MFWINWGKIEHKPTQHNIHCNQKGLTEAQKVYLCKLEQHRGHFLSILRQLVSIVENYLTSFAYYIIYHWNIFTLFSSNPIFSSYLKAFSKSSVTTKMPHCTFFLFICSIFQIILSIAVSLDFRKPDCRSLILSFLSYQFTNIAFIDLWNILPNLNSRRL